MQQTIQNRQNAETLREELRSAQDLSKDLQKELEEKEAQLKNADLLNEDIADLKKQLHDLSKQHEELLLNGKGDVLTLLSSLQKQGRFIDFVMGDISQFPDSQIGAAARVVHRGCQTAMSEYLDLEPIHGDQEGSTVPLKEDEQGELYRFIGDLDSEPPKQGRLVHKGWKTKKLQLPRRTNPVNANQMIISPAEVEI